MATRDEPGPVFIDIPVNLQTTKADVTSVKPYQASNKAQYQKEDLLQQAAEMLCNAKNPGIFAGWGAQQATDDLVELAEWLAAPVATTLQGLSVFPANHPLHTGMGIGISAVPAAENAFKNVNALLAIGTRFSEIPTGSFGIEPTENLIHLDINPDVFKRQLSRQNLFRR